MIKFSAFFCAIALVIGGMSSATLESAEKKSVHMEGTFVWKTRKKDTHDVKATLTETDEKGVYDVRFDFTWKNKGDQVYTGTAKGSVTEGVLAGEVNDGGEKRLRTFTFTGESVDGVFTATHKETTTKPGKASKPRDTGTMTLKLKKE
ncbi:MAG: hypothetical protein HRU15_05780 [Planctomycetes bacterium]|nr:hypothetical protein [Planctomycetota bacterium]